MKDTEGKYTDTSLKHNIGKALLGEERKNGGGKERGKGRKRARQGRKINPATTKAI